MLPLRVICDRLNIMRVTFRAWKMVGHAALDKPEADLSEYQRLCRQLVIRLDEIQRQQKKKLAENIKEPSHAETARLVLSLSPGLEFIESVNRV